MIVQHHRCRRLRQLNKKVATVTASVETPTNPNDLPVADGDVVTYILVQRDDVDVRDWVRKRERRVAQVADHTAPERCRDAPAAPTRRELDGISGLPPIGIVVVVVQPGVAGTAVWRRPRGVVHKER